MRVDVTLGSGWPFGGPHIPVTRSCRQAARRADDVAAGSTFALAPYLRCRRGADCRVSDPDCSFSRRNGRTRFRSDAPMAGRYSFSVRGSTAQTALLYLQPLRHGRSNVRRSAPKDSYSITTIVPRLRTISTPWAIGCSRRSAISLLTRSSVTAWKTTHRTGRPLCSTNFSGGAATICVRICWR